MSKIISRCAKTFSGASCMCVEGRLKQEKYKEGGGVRTPRTLSLDPTLRLMLKIQTKET